MPELWSRHQILHPSPISLRGAEALTHSDPTTAHRAAQHWLERGLPVIVSIPCHDPLTHTVTCGFPSPASEGGAKWRLHLADNVLPSPETPPSLAQLLDHFPHLADTSIPSMDAFVTGHGGQLHVVGSHAWQFLTGFTYLHPHSDLDLLLELPSASSWTTSFQKQLRELIHQPTPFRVDLEIRFSRNLAFPWREWESPGEKLLVKTNAGPRLITKPDFLSCSTLG